MSTCPNCGIEIETYKINSAQWRWRRIWCGPACQKVWAQTVARDIWVDGRIVWSVGR